MANHPSIKIFGSRWAPLCSATLQIELSTPESILTCQTLRPMRPMQKLQDDVSCEPHLTSRKEIGAYTTDYMHPGRYVRIKVSSEGKAVFDVL